MTAATIPHSPLSGTLSDDQKRTYVEQGFLKLPGIVPPELVLRARRAINANLGEKGMDPAELGKYRSQTYCPDLTRQSPITDLYNETGIKTVAEELIGPGMVRPVNYGQIAPRFPRAEDPTSLTVNPHLDGMYSPSNGVKEGTIGNFTALVGVFLSDLPEPNAGNFTVWPGTHKLYESYFREHGPESLLKGMPPVTLPTPEQFIGKAGDAALVHYQIAHGIAPNISPNIRYAIFFRLHHINHEQYHWDCMTDVWAEWNGLRNFV